jgi:hypothetical protein
MSFANEFDPAGTLPSLNSLQPHRTAAEKPPRDTLRSVQAPQSSRRCAQEVEHGKRANRTTSAFTCRPTL